jgi:hypothetical protein
MRKEDFDLLALLAGFPVLVRGGYRAGNVTGRFMNAAANPAHGRLWTTPLLQAAASAIVLAGQINNSVILSDVALLLLGGTLSKDGIVPKETPCETPVSSSLEAHQYLKYRSVWTDSSAKWLFTSHRKSQTRIIDSRRETSTGFVI